ncbi:alpha/beta hydrolase family protein [Psychroflexus sp. MBR-150]|jgi:alpha/beta superfamily hydrolase
MKNFLFLFVFIVFSSNLFSQNIEGKWTGKINTKSNQLNIIFDIKKSGISYKSSLSIPQQGLDNLEANSTEFENNELLIKFSINNLFYKGELKKDEIIGYLYQNNFKKELILKKSGLQVKRPQQPYPPFNYNIEDVSFINSDDEIKLKGTFTYPKHKKKFPIVIIVSGSGPQNRNGTMFGHEPYHVIANHLTKKGIGVLRYDERGIGESEGDFYSAGIEEFASDLEAAIRFLRIKKSFKKNKIGLAGHSIGGIIAPKVAIHNPNIDFLILLAAPGLDGDKLMVKQKVAFEKALGISEMQIIFGKNIINNAYQIIRNTDLNQKRLRDSIGGYLQTKYKGIINDAQIDALLNQITGKEYISLIKTSPSKYLKKLNIPVLALNGSHDLQVTPDNLHEIKQIIEKNGNKMVKAVELDSLNHLFQTSKTGLTKEYFTIEQTIAPKALNLMVNWILEDLKKL